MTTVEERLACLECSKEFQATKIDLEQQKVAYSRLEVRFAELRVDFADLEKDFAELESEITAKESETFSKSVFAAFGVLAIVIALLSIFVSVGLNLITNPS